MAKKSSSKISVGAQIRVRDGVTCPEVPEVEIAGWTGTVAEVAGRRAEVKYMIEWDQPTLDNMPGAYLESCESRGLYHKMACLTGEQIEVSQ